MLAAVGLSSVFAVAAPIAHLPVGAGSVEAQEIEDKYVQMTVSLNCPKGDSGELEHTLQNKAGYHEQRIVTFTNGEPKFLSLADKEDNQGYGTPLLIDLEQLTSRDEDQQLYLLDLVEETSKLLRDICFGPPDVQKRYFETVARNREVLEAATQNH
jgi:hypothetical protein